MWGWGVKRTWKLAWGSGWELGFPCMGDEKRAGRAVRGSGCEAWEEMLGVGRPESEAGGLPGVCWAL